MIHLRNDCEQWFAQVCKKYRAKAGCLDTQRNTQPQKPENTNRPVSTMRFATLEQSQLKLQPHRDNYFSHLNITSSIYVQCYEGTLAAQPVSASEREKKLTSHSTYYKYVYNYTTAAAAVTR